MPQTTLPDSALEPTTVDMSTQHRQIAETILAQLGGRRFLAMTGARDLGFIGPALRFALPNRFAKDGINRVEIRLTPMDLYRVIAHRVATPRGGIPTPTLVADEDDIFAEDLRQVFTRMTGLALSL